MVFPILHMGRALQDLISCALTIIGKTQGDCRTIPMILCPLGRDRAGAVFPMLLMGWALQDLNGCAVTVGDHRGDPRGLQNSSKECWNWNWNRNR